MSAYTTGEIAKSCGVSVRTVQFYDTKGLLIPTELTEGGRRLYSEEDLKKLRQICLLKSLGLSLDSIKGVMESENPQKVLKVFLEEQKRQLEIEIESKQKQRKAIEAVNDDIGILLSNPENPITDIDTIMENRKKLKNVFGTVLAAGIFMDLVEIGTLIFGIRTGIWWPFAVGMVLVILCVFPLVHFYHKKVDYICPECNARFKPAMGEFFWARHTPKMRKLTCTCCHKKGWCVETYSLEGNQ